MKTEILYQNNWCKIISKDTLIILKSKKGNYNDQYFLSLDDALKAIGVLPKTQRFSFNTTVQSEQIN